MSITHLLFIRKYILFLIVAGLSVFRMNAQDLEPRLLSPTPTRMNFAIASYGYSAGNILLDNSLPVKDLRASLHNVVGAYARSFRIFNRQAKFDIVIPYSFGHFKGEVYDVDSTTSRIGFGDPLVRLSVILIGSKAMDAREFVTTPQKRFNLGISVRMRPPLGQYDYTKLINLGANRWAFKVGLGGSYAFGKKFILEAHVNSWFFTANNSFFNGNTLKQKPLMTIQLHGIYSFKPGVWLAVSIGKSLMGETELNGNEQNDERNDWRYGAAFGYRINKQHAIKIGFTTGVSTRYGADFTSFVIAYQFSWFDKKQKQFKINEYEKFNLCTTAFPFPDELLI